MSAPAPQPAEPPGLELVAHSASPIDADRGVVRLDPADMARLGVRAGEIVSIAAKKTTYARVLPAHARHRGLGLAMIDGAQRENAGAAIGEPVRVAKAEAKPAAEARFVMEGLRASQQERVAELLRLRLIDQPIAAGDVLRTRLFGGRTITLSVKETSPDGPVMVGQGTRIAFAALAAAAPASGRGLSYEDLGGLSEQIARVREMIELPLRRPELFERLGVDAPKGVLFTGPPGTGKTLLAKAVAHESGAAFFQIAGPEIVSKHYGDSEAALRKLFADAAARAPSVIFIDEIDAIAPKRDAMAGDRQLERRVVAQLLTLLDGLSERGQVVVMAATNLPDSLDPALRRPGRFDREIAFRPPDRPARREIIAIHTRGMPLADDVDLERLAGATHGYVGADLAALAREAAMAALRRAAQGATLDAIDADSLHVTSADFTEAQKTVGPSAIREVFTEIPEVRWSDVGGLESVKDALAEAVIWPLRHGDAFARLGVEPTRGILLAGPPGCGKTHLAKALANESALNFISVRGPQLLSKYVGESERAVRDVFAKARLAAPCIVFFDEIDALAPRREAGGEVSGRVVAQLLTEIDGVEELKGVFLLAATNRVEAVDPALIRPGRFDLVLRLDPPDAAARLEILTIATCPMTLADDVSLPTLAERTQGLVGADLKALAQAAARLALKRGVRGEGEAIVRAADFDEALAIRAASDAERFGKGRGA